MAPFVQGWGLTIALCALIVLVFLAATSRARCKPRASTSSYANADP
jgi:hypothetical protein